MRRKSSCRHGGTAHAQAAGLERGFVAGDGVFVGGDAAEFEDALDACAVDGFGFEVDEDEVVVGAAGDDVVAEAAGVGAVAQSLC